MFKQIHGYWQVRQHMKFDMLFTIHKSKTILHETIIFINTFCYQVSAALKRRLVGTHLRPVGHPHNSLIYISSGERILILHMGYQQCYNAFLRKVETLYVPDLVLYWYWRNLAFPENIMVPGHIVGGDW